MRISTLVLASAFVWVVAPGSAIADSNESDVAGSEAAEVVEAAAPPEAVAAPDDGFAAEPTETAADETAPPAALACVQRAGEERKTPDTQKGRVRYVVWDLSSHTSLSNQRLNWWRLFLAKCMVLINVTSS